MKNKLSFILLNAVLSLLIVIAGIAITGIIYKRNESNSVETKNVVSTVESDVEDLYSSTVDGVVYIEASTFSGTGSGSGFIYKIENGFAYILTNYHVAGDSRSLAIVTNKGERVDGVEFLGGDSLYDIAVIRAKVTDSMITLPLSKGSSFDIGEHVLAIGSPLGEEYINTATYGIISGKERYIVVNEENQWGLSLIQTDTVMNPGNSGGPLFSMGGEVIGINTIKYVYEGVEGMGFSIPMDIVVPKLSALEEGKDVRPILGVSTKDTEKNVEVAEVLQGGAAAKAGIQKGDIIISFNGVKTKDSKTLRNEVNKLVVGAKVDVVINRGGEEKTVKVVLGGNAN